MRRKEKRPLMRTQPGFQDAPPIPEVLALGCLVEVWAHPSTDDSPDPYHVPRIRSADDRHRAAHTGWERLYGPDAAGPLGIVWSTVRPRAQEYDAECWSAYVDARLAAIGCTASDLPNLRAAAEEVLTTVRAHLDEHEASLWVSQ